MRLGREQGGRRKFDHRNGTVLRRQRAISQPYFARRAHVGAGRVQATALRKARERAAVCRSSGCHPPIYVLGLVPFLVVRLPPKRKSDGDRGAPISQR